MRRRAHLLQCPSDNLLHRRRALARLLLQLLAPCMSARCRHHVTDGARVCRLDIMFPRFSLPKFRSTPHASPCTSSSLALPRRNRFLGYTRCAGRSRSLPRLLVKMCTNTFAFLRGHAAHDTTTASTPPAFPALDSWLPKLPVVRALNACTLTFAHQPNLGARTLPPSLLLRHQRSSNR